MLIPSSTLILWMAKSSLSRRVNANSQRMDVVVEKYLKLIKKGEC